MRHTNHIELTDVQASRIAVDSSGQFAALAGPRELTVFAFDQPNQLHTFPLNIRSEPAGLAWQPDNPGRLAIVRHTRCELLTWDAVEGRLSLCHGLGGYVRPITSLDWSPCHPHLLVTSSADQFRAICVWDLRDLTRPIRAIESLSAPSIVKWSRVVQGKFACSHRNEIRLWDLRANVAEEFLTESPGASVTDFDWHPTMEGELCAAYCGGRLRVWQSHSSEAPKCSIQLPGGPARKVSYSPSGDHVITLPEANSWPHTGLGTWDATGLQKSTRGLWTTESGRTGASQPKATDPTITTFAWRKVSNTTPVGRVFDQDDCFNPDGEESVGMDSIPKECLLQLVTWSVDCQVRLYPIQWSMVNVTRDPLASTTTTTTAATTKHTRQGSGTVDPVDPSSSGSGLSVHAGPSTTKGTTRLSSSSTPTTTATLTTTTSASVEPRPHVIRRLQSGTGPTTKSKSGDPSSSRGEEFHPRIGLSKWASTGLSLGSAGSESKDRTASVEDNAYQVLAQELSLLSPRAGQYKLEEIDLINRTAKLMLHYCRRRHFHHYTVCAVATGGDRGRRNSSELDDNGDLESLLLPANDLLPSMDTSGRPERCRSSEELDTLSGDETGRDPGSNTCPAPRSQSAQITPVQSVKPTQLHAPPTQQALTARLSVRTNSLDQSSSVAFSMPLSGTVTLSVAFPLTYPASVPVFTVTDHNPSLPSEVIEQLKQVLHKSACELAHTSRGCMGPCVRKAIEFLQNVTSLHLSTSANHSERQSEDVTDTTGEVDEQNLHEDGASIGPLPSTQIDVEYENASRCPFPRLSGVHFAPNGHLVTFGLSHGSWHTVVTSIPIDTTATHSSAGNSVPTTKASTAAGLQWKAWLPRTFHEFRQTRQLLWSIQLQRRRSGDTGKDIQRRKAAQPNADSPPDEESDLTNGDRNSGEMQLKEMIQELVLGSIEVDRISNVPSPVAGQVSRRNVAQRHRGSETVLANGKNQTPDEASVTVQSAVTPNTKFRTENLGLPQCRSVVQLYDLSMWLIDRNLVRQYSLKNENVQEMCVHNYSVALNTGRKDLIRFWQYAIVLSASFASCSSVRDTVPPWPLQPMGWSLFREWISYFERASDVQNLVMAILVLQGLDVMYKNQLRTPLPSSNSILALSYFHERNASSRDLHLHPISKPNLDSRPVTTSTGFDFSPSDTTVSFTLDTSYDLPGEEDTTVNLSTTTVEDGAPIHDRMTPHQTSWNDTKFFSQNQSVAQRFAKNLRFVSNDQLSRFAHYISVYADILYSLGAFLRHARLLRAWTWGLRSKALTQSVQVSTRDLPHTRTHTTSWPLGVAEVLLLPLCPTCAQPTAPVCSSDLCSTSPINTVQCAQCNCDFTVPSSGGPLTGTTDVLPRPHLPNLQCTVCRTRVRGLVFLCERCNHGGHMDHLSQWFRGSSTSNQPRQCPALNCLCYCVPANRIPIEPTFVA